MSLISLYELRKTGWEKNMMMVIFWWLMKNGNFIIKLEVDAGVDDQILAKSTNQTPCHLGSYILSHSKRSMNNFFREIDGFYSNNVPYGHTDSAYHHKKQWSALVE